MQLCLYFALFHARCGVSTAVRVLALYNRRDNYGVHEPFGRHLIPQHANECSLRIVCPGGNLTANPDGAVASSLKFSFLIRIHKPNPDVELPFYSACLPLEGTAGPTER